MKITEEILSELGFVQQNPPHIWDYPMNGVPSFFRFCKIGEQWMFILHKNHPIAVSDVMSAIRVVAVISRNDGVQETQNKLYEALGLDRLLEKTIEAYSNSQT